MKVVVKRTLRFLLGERKSTRIFFMARRGIRNIHITRLIAKLAYDKYICGGGGANLSK